jgi:hypothetical protein
MRADSDVPGVLGGDASVLLLLPLLLLLLFADARLLPLLPMIGDADAGATTGVSRDAPIASDVDDVSTDGVVSCTYAASFCVRVCA